MFGICVEASHQRGLGHLFRMLNFSKLLSQRGIAFRIFINADEAAEAILQQAGIPHETIPLTETGWQQQMIEKYALKIWIDDRLDTSIPHAMVINACGLERVTFDDRGAGATHASLNVAALSFTSMDIPGKRTLSGPRYLILNQEIAHYRRLRDHLHSIVVSMGGSDTYGATLRVVQLLKELGKNATIILGPGFRHDKELDQILDDGFTIKRNVPSLVAEFSHHDLAITGGGVTPFEANAAGLPCLVIANEDFEIPVCRGIEALGGALFAGHHSEFRLDFLAADLPLQKMSENAMREIDLLGASRVLDAIEALL